MYNTRTRNTSASLKRIGCRSQGFPERELPRFRKEASILRTETFGSHSLRHGQMILRTKTFGSPKEIHSLFITVLTHVPTRVALCKRTRTRYRAPQSQQSRTRNSASQSHCAASDTPPRRRRRAVEGKRNTKVTTTQRTQQAGQERVINWSTRCGAKDRQDSKGSSWSCSNAFELREVCNSAKQTKGRGHLELSDSATNSQLHMTLRTPVCLQLCSGCTLANSRHLGHHAVTDRI